MQERRNLRVKENQNKYMFTSLFYDCNLFLVRCYNANQEDSNQVSNLVLVVKLFIYI